MTHRVKKLLKIIIYKILIINFLRKYKDSHRGEACYIFGDGPSIKWFDISEFSNLNAISVNWFIFHKDFKGLKVKYCTLAEPWALMPKWLRPHRENLDGVKFIIERYRQYISDYAQIKFFVHFSNLTSICSNRIDFLPKTVKNNQKDNEIKKIDFFKGSFHTSLSLAYMMGFTRVYLVGFDAYTLRPVRHGHWYECGEGEIIEWNEDINKFVNFISQKIEIFAISKDKFDSAKCKDIKLISYKDFTGRLPVYKENTELLHESNRAILSSYKGYKIQD